MFSQSTRALGLCLACGSSERQEHLSLLQELMVAGTSVQVPVI